MRHTSSPMKELKIKLRYRRELYTLLVFVLVVLRYSTFPRIAYYVW